MSKIEMLAKFNKDGRRLGDCVERASAHETTEIIHGEVGVLVVWKGKVLFQKRSINKSVLPGWWSTGCAGHVGCGVGVCETLVFEMSEELELETNTNDFEFVGKELVTKEEYGRAECHWKHWYVYRIDSDDEPSFPETDEVDQSRFLDEIAIQQLEQNGASVYEDFVKVCQMFWKNDFTNLDQEESDE